MTVYISGPVTGTADYQDRFAEAEARLRKAGHTAVNPAAVNGRLPEGSPYEMYMAMLGWCHAICMMPGWAASAGANREYDWAVSHGLKLVDFDTGEVMDGTV